LTQTMPFNFCLQFRRQNGTYEMDIFNTHFIPSNTPFYVIDFYNFLGENSN